ncbi:DUF3817 domain-containing protein [Herbaspirillum sp. WKF16]|uniref:DUF3817 domain-containing protein n=1 Tax=Herbaspirillum sp. WKF16 TaxID=3028312 RepID=UPI0023AA00C0|nr:DUF3817 domain-containing protein [Herbaspirillum sp. WKF16]WDZ96966.1 DUF3817 domain-containing protein [Herbaspirillum sp. WKF16]
MPDTAPPNQTSPDEVKQLRRLELTSLFEATTLILLLAIAVPLKHWGGWPLGVEIMGPIHGIAFCAYLWIIIQTSSATDWRAGEVLRMIVLAVLPAGGFFNASLVSRKINLLRPATRP